MLAITVQIHFDTQLQLHHLLITRAEDKNGDDNDKDSAKEEEEHRRGEGAIGGRKNTQGKACDGERMKRKALTEKEKVKKEEDGKRKSFQSANNNSTEAHLVFVEEPLKKRTLLRAASEYSDITRSSRIPFFIVFRLLVQKTSS